MFAKYAELGSLTKTHAFFVANGVRLGLRIYKGPGKGELVWRRPRRSTLYEMLRHPFYAGAYAYGRCPLDPTRRAGGKKAGRRTATPEEWVCLLRDKVPAYISWEQFQSNLQRLRQQRQRGPLPGPAQQRVSLLAGWVVCGRCGCRMQAQYTRTLPECGAHTFSSSDSSFSHGPAFSACFCGTTLDMR